MPSLTLPREIATSRGHVWACLTEPETLAAWFWPPSLAAQVAADVREGGSYRIASPTTGMAVAGRYLEIAAPDRLRLTWHWDGEPAETTVTLTLEASPTGTLLTVVHDGFLSDAERDEHLQGWTDCLDRLPTGPLE